jgi:hypothetical protein
MAVGMPFVRVQNLFWRAEGCLRVAAHPVAEARATSIDIDTASHY